MKNLFLTLILLASSAVGMAQINLREGIVITLAGDTLHGSIDYRTDPMNSEQCLFIPDGKNEPIIYRPGEIAGYRFLDNGRFYVTKKITDWNSRTRTFFLEYIVRGNLSLYRLSSSVKDDTFLLEDENGQMVQFSEEDQLIEKELHRKNLKPVLAMTNQSQSTQKLLWEQAINRKTVTKAVVNYNNEVCPDGVCEVLEFKNKKTPNSERLFHPTIKIGMVNSNYNLTDNYETSNNYTLQYTIGMDYYASRLAKGIFASIDISYYQTSTKEKKENYIKRWPTSYAEHIRTIDVKDLYWTVGGGYQWQKYRLQPRLQLGYAFSASWINAKSAIEGTETGLGGICLIGFYLGAGAAYPIKKGALLIDWKYSTNGASKDKEEGIRRHSLSIGYQFGY